MQEFDIIKKYFTPLSAGFSGALGLCDDAAVFAPPAGHELVITKDAISEGVHFIGSESTDLIAGKALRVNLSDLAAMGATPICYFLALILPKNTPEEWVQKFADGLRKTQSEFDIHLAGGDTISTLGTLSISITAIGSVPTGSALRRNGAQIGDNIYVSGTLGDASLGLKALSAEIRVLSAEYLANRYLTPQPRLALGQSLRGVASACMDISDGLVQDLGHICTASKVGAVIYADKIPLSEAAVLFCHPRVGGDLNNSQKDSRLRGNDNTDILETALSGGDDYELLFTAPPEKAHLIPKNCTKIGQIITGKNVQIIGANGEEITLNKKGFVHF
jgi:thiamine-monophosphate kinase